MMVLLLELLFCFLMSSFDECIYVVSSSFFNDTIFLFVGSLMIALAMEKWNLHRRVALRLLMIFGNKPRMLLLGFMLTTGGISMFMSNISTTGLMV